jgi:hypothetical protein
LVTSGQRNASQILSDAAILLSAAYPEALIFWGTAAEEPLEIVYLCHCKTTLI